MAYTKLIPRSTPGASVEEIHLRMAARRIAYLFLRAQQTNTVLPNLMTIRKLREASFLLRPPIRLSLSARTSSNSIPGTWGFGLWNDPFGLSLGFGGNPFRLACPAERSLVLWRVEGKLSIIQRRQTVTRISRADVSFAKVSSIVDPCRAGAPLFAQGNAPVDGKGG